MPGCVFAVGYDTAARLVQPRYQCSCVCNMEEGMTDDGGAWCSGTTTIVWQRWPRHCKTLSDMAAGSITLRLLLALLGTG